MLGEDDVTGDKFGPFIVKNHVKSQSDFKPFTKNHDVFKHSENVKDALVESGCASSPFLRIDSFETWDRKLVCNEVESLDACFFWSGQKQPDGKRAKADTSSKLETFRENYWEHKAFQLFQLSLKKYFKSNF